MLMYKWQWYFFDCTFLYNAIPIYLCKHESEIRQVVRWHLLSVSYACNHNVTSMNRIQRQFRCVLGFGLHSLFKLLILRIICCLIFSWTPPVSLSFTYNLGVWSHLGSNGVVKNKRDRGDIGFVLCGAECSFCEINGCKMQPDHVVINSRCKRSS